MEQTVPTWFVPGEPAFDQQCTVDGCGLIIFHCHIQDQIFFSKEEVDQAYPDGLPEDPYIPTVSDANKMFTFTKGKWTEIGTATGVPQISYHTQSQPHKNTVHTSPSSPAGSQSLGSKPVEGDIWIQTDAPVGSAVSLDLGLDRTIQLHTDHIHIDLDYRGSQLRMEELIAKGVVMPTFYPNVGNI
jgi:hypothetical protein